MEEPHARPIFPDPPDPPLEPEPEPEPEELLEGAGALEAAAVVVAAGVEDGAAEDVDLGLQRFVELDPRLRLAIASWA